MPHCLSLIHILSRVYPLDDAMQAFEDCVNKRQSMVKAVLKISDD